MLNNPKTANNFLASLFAALPTPAQDIHITADTHLAQDLFAISLIIDAGVTLFTDNYRIYVLTSLINNGTISNIGANGTNGTAITPGTGGINPPDAYFLAGIAGQDGVLGGNNGLSASNPTNVILRYGGGGGNAGAFLGGTIATGTPPPFNIRSLFDIMHSFSIQDIIEGSITQFNVAVGSGSGAADVGAASSGGSGASGGIILINCISLINNGTITVHGGNAGLPFNNGVTAVGGSGSGAGGLIITISNLLTVGTLDTLAGTKSNGVNTGLNGSNGQPGQSITIVN